MDLWRKLDFREIEAKTISDFRTAVNGSDNSANMKAACAALDKLQFGAGAVRGLLNLWRELSLRRIDGKQSRN